jgi:serine/threonine-protein kinase PknK
LTEEFPRITILLLSAHIEVEHAMELLASGGRVGYLLKSRVTDVEECYTDAEPGCRGGAMIDPSLVHELVPGAATGRSAGRSQPAAAGGACFHG